MRCPHCASTRVVTRDYAQKTCGLIGALVGAAASGLSRETVRSDDALGALLGAGSGAVAGVNLGQVIDTRILNNHVCLDCGEAFRPPRPDFDEAGPYRLGDES